MRISFTILFFAGICFSSCKKFLEETSASDLTPQTTEDYSQLLLGTAYPSRSIVMLGQIPWMTDDFQMYANPPDENTDIVLKPAFPAFTWQYNYLDFYTPTATGVVTPWKTFYQLISGCNIALDAVDGSTGTAEEKNQLKAEASGLRAFYYWFLVNLYGNPYNDSTTTPDKRLGVPVIISPDLRDKPVARNTVGAVYDQIRKDIETAVSTFAIDKRKGTPYRFNYPAAALLASRIYLHTEEWEKVIAHASVTIGLKPAIINLNDWPADYYYDLTTFRPIYTKENVETVFLYGNRSEYNETANLNMGLSEDLGAQYESKDLRTVIYFSAVPEPLQWFIPVKYFEQKRGIATQDLKELLTSLRVTEAYLNRAEAYAQLYIKSGDATMAQKAVDDLNYIRSRRFKPADFQPVAIMPGAELLQFCRNERRRELFEEGQRWFDLRRYGMPSLSHVYIQQAQSSTYVLKKGDPLYTLQIPREAIALNPMLEQNPGTAPRNPQ